MYPDFHLHTGFSYDSQEKVENTIEKAISLGMDAICITDHYDMDCPNGDFCLDTPAYLEKMQEVRDTYAGRITVHIGVEIGMEPPLSGTGKPEAFLARYPFEYAVGSVHYVDHVDPFYRDQLDMSDEELYRRYFAQLREVICGCGGYQTVAHLDYVNRYGWDRGRACLYESYREPIDAILEHVVAQGLVLEVNTAGYRKGPDAPNPQEAILRRYRELGGEKVILGSDAHAAADVGADFDRAAALLKDLGFRYLTLKTMKEERQFPL